MPRLRPPRHPAALARQCAAALLLVAALVLAARPAPAPARTPEPVAVAPVVTAARDLPAGTALTDGDLEVRELPAALVPGGTVPAAGPLAGRVLAAPVRAGEPVTDVRLVGPGLWAQVPAGEVAAPVRLADLGVASLLRAGDRVDVLASPADGGATVVVAASALVLTVAAGSQTDPGLLVLAVGPDVAAALAGAATASTLTVTVGPP